MEKVIFVLFNDRNKGENYCYKKVVSPRTRNEYYRIKGTNTLEDDENIDHSYNACSYNACFCSQY